MRLPCENSSHVLWRQLYFGWRRIYFSFIFVFVCLSWLWVCLHQGKSSSLSFESHVASHFVLYSSSPHIITHSFIMRRKPQEDPIAPHSKALCEYMNGHPIIVLSYARYFGEYAEAESASMDQIDQDGFIVKCVEHGQDHEVRVAFTHSLHAISQVKDMLMSLAKEAENALRGPDPKAQVPSSFTL
jgi:putative heme iron utilization protein